MVHRNCGGHCPTENKNPSYSVNCRICKKLFHLPCYDVINPAVKVLVSKNIVFNCDACLDEIDSGKLVVSDSPGRKRKNANNNNTSLKQSVLSSNANGNVTLQAQQSISNNSSKKPTTEDLYALMSSIADKLDTQSKKIDEMSKDVDSVGDGIMATHQKTIETYNIVHSRMMLREQQDLRDLAKIEFRSMPKPNQTKTLQTPNGNEHLFGGKHRAYSTVLQSKLPVTPRPETPTNRKREMHISLINNATGATVKTAKFPTPKQGKKKVQIGRPVEQRQRVPRKENPMSKSIHVCKFSTDTTTDDIENYIVENTTATDKSKFKCTKLVKKDADITKMKFVSFKIDATPEVFDILIDEENWPEDKQVREFIKLSPDNPTLADHFPAINPSRNALTQDEIDESNTYAMEIMTELSKSGATSSSINGKTNNNGNDTTTTPPKN